LTILGKLVIVFVWRGGFVCPIAAFTPPAPGSNDPISCGNPAKAIGTTRLACVLDGAHRRIREMAARQSPRVTC
jgi:hypothetical protein